MNDDQTKNIENLLKNLPPVNIFGLIIRGKSKTSIYKRAKLFGKICKKKRLPFYISTFPNIALLSGADGVHYPKNIKFSRKLNGLKVSCSFHGLNGIRRVRDLKANRAFLSPIFKTTSSIQKKPLGLKMLNIYFSKLGCKKAVLGGMDIDKLRELRNRNISSVGGISFLSHIVNEKKC